MIHSPGTEPLIWDWPGDSTVINEAQTNMFIV